MSFPGLITCGRALLDAYIKGENSDRILN